MLESVEKKDIEEKNSLEKHRFKFYIYIRVCMCVCVCMYVCKKSSVLAATKAIFFNIKSVVSLSLYPTRNGREV